MLEFAIFGIRVRISVLFPASLIVMLSLGEAALSLQCLSASLLHECGHLAAMMALGDHPSRVCLGVFGARVERDPTRYTSYAAQAAVSLAGPLANVLCAAVLYGLSGMSDGVLIHLVLGGFHLLPVAGLDGGEAVYRLLCAAIAEQTAHTVLLIVSVLLLLPLAVLGFYLLFLSGHNASLLIVALYLILLLIFKEKH